MGVTGKRIFVVLIGALGMSLAALGVAWACTSWASFNVSEQVVSPGDVITLNGQDYKAGNEVEVRWGSKTGPILATAITTEQRTFHASVTIPADAQAGEHLLFAIVPDLYPVADEGVVALRVLGDEPEPVVAPEPEPVDEAEPVVAPEFEAEPVDEAEPVVAPEPAPEPVAVAEPVAEPVPAPQPVAPVPAPAPQAAPVQPAPVSQAPAVTPAPAPTVDHGAVNPAPVPEPVAASVVAEPVRVPAALTNGVVVHTASQPRHVPGALTNGVAPEPVQATTTDTETARDSAALTNGWATPERGAHEWAGVPESGSTTSAIGAGLGLLAVGLMMLMAGFTVAALTRRKKAKVTGR